MLWAILLFCKIMIKCLLWETLILWDWDMWFEAKFLEKPVGILHFVMYGSVNKIGSMQ